MYESVHMSCEKCSAWWMLFLYTYMYTYILLTALTATSGEDTHITVREGYLLRGGCGLPPFRSLLVKNICNHGYIVTV